MEKRFIDNYDSRVKWHTEAEDLYRTIELYIHTGTLKPEINLNTLIPKYQTVMGKLLENIEELKGLVEVKDEYRRQQDQDEATD